MKAPDMSGTANYEPTQLLDTDRPGGPSPIREPVAAADVDVLNALKTYTDYPSGNFIHGSSRRSCGGVLVSLMEDLYQGTGLSEAQ